MEVTKLSKKEHITVKDDIDLSIDIGSELSFYLSQKIIEDMFLFGLISLAEYEEIRRINIKNFSPFLAEIMQ